MATAFLSRDSHSSLSRHSGSASRYHSAPIVYKNTTASVSNFTPIANHQRTVVRCPDISVRHGQAQLNCQDIAHNTLTRLVNTVQRTTHIVRPRTSALPPGRSEPTKSASRHAGMHIPRQSNVRQLGPEKPSVIYSRTHSYVTQKQPGNVQNVRVSAPGGTAKMKVANRAVTAPPGKTATFVLSSNEYHILRRSVDTAKQMVANQNTRYVNHYIWDAV